MEEGGVEETTDDLKKPQPVGIPMGVVTKDLSPTVKEQIRQNIEKKTTQSPVNMNVRISVGEIVVSNLIGTGNFGEVYSGTWLGTEVALKKLKDRAKMNDFYEEAQILSHLNHPNIVRMLGTFEPDAESMYMVFEYVANGNLHSWLQSNEAEEIPADDFIKWIVQIAAGMRFLHSRNIIHRDLAARNILVGNDEMKISDFGMSRETDEYYFANSPTFALRWAAPEVIKFRKFSTQSDIWSFGIVMWEIYTKGKHPYHDIVTNEELSEKVSSGYQLLQPPNCPDYVYELMRRCWNMTPKSRPDFNTITQELTLTYPTIEGVSLNNVAEQDDYYDEEGLLEN